MSDELLSVGSVVKLEDKTGISILITGYYPYDMETGDMFVYSGTFYPYGIVDDRSVIMFNPEDVVEVVFHGYEDEDGKRLKKSLNKLQSVCTSLASIVS